MSWIDGMSNSPPLQIDFGEPARAIELLSQACPVEVLNLNQKGMADYCWVDAENRLHQLERKRWDELCADINAVEYQLLRYLAVPSDLGLLIEEFVMPTSSGMRTYSKPRVDERGALKAFHSASYARPYSGIMAKLWSMHRFIEIWTVPNLDATAIAIAAFYHNSMRPSEEHLTFRRNLLGRPQFNANPYVRTLMGVIDPERRTLFGPKLSEQLIERFGTPWAVYSASRSELIKVDGIGVTRAQRLWRALGRKE